MSDFVGRPTTSGRRTAAGVGGAVGPVSARPPSSSMKPRNTGASSMGRMPPATGTVPGTARPGTRGGTAAAAGALSAQISVADRPMTQQGLTGMKTGSKGPQRQVQDRSFFLGQLRSKINELSTENIKLAKEIENFTQENTTFLSYEKKAETLAAEIRELQGQLADYNTLVDKISVDSEIVDVQAELNELKGQNDAEERSMDTIFAERRDKEEQIRGIEGEIQDVQRFADSLIEDMNTETRRMYTELKERNNSLVQDLEMKQQLIDALNSKKIVLDEELQSSDIKREAVNLYERISELQGKRDTLVEETQNKGSPEEEQKRLLKQVKDDNQEIAGMEHRMQGMREQITQMQDDIRRMDNDLEEQQGEKQQKYRELRKREDQMNEFMGTFEENSKSEVERITNVQRNVVSLLEQISRNLGLTKHMPTQSEFANMKDDLNMKENEMHKSQTTSQSLNQQHHKLQMELSRVEMLEPKVQSELTSLRDRMIAMEQGMDVYGNLDGLKDEAEERKTKLVNDKKVLSKRRDVTKKSLQTLSTQYETMKSKLQDNETHTQLGNLERKWQHHEQNNFVMKEFISAKTSECDYKPTVKNVTQSISSFNHMLQDSVNTTR